MTSQFFPVDPLRRFSTNGLIYRAFNHLIAARMGTLLMVPMQLIAGRCDDLIDGCPVPWEEVHAVLEYPHQLIRHPHHDKGGFGRFGTHAEQLINIGIDPAACRLDHISPMINGEAKVLRLIHPCGVRYAVVLG